jgi:hypothetical protein
MIANAPDDAESLAVGALEWLLKAAREVDGGLTWPDTLADDEFNPMLYSGTSGVLPALLDGWRYFGDDRYADADAAVRGARGVADAVDDWEQSSLYTGVAGMAVALRGVHRVLGDTAAGAAAERVLDVLRSRYDGAGWNDYFELIVGNAGIALAALECGDLDLALLAVDRFPRTDASRGCAATGSSRTAPYRGRCRPCRSEGRDGRGRRRRRWRGSRGHCPPGRTRGRRRGWLPPRCAGRRASPAPR